jgi:hypothetical protein
MFLSRRSLYTRFESATFRKSAVRETISFFYRARGASTLLEFLHAQREYRDTQLAIEI